MRRLFLDYDLRTLAYVLDDLRRLQRKFGLGEADVYESRPPQTFDASSLGQGKVQVSSWHVQFRDSLAWDQIEEILLDSKCSWGYKQFSLKVADSTLRIGPKIKEKIPAPKLIGVLKKMGGFVRDAI